MGWNGGDRLAELITGPSPPLSRPDIHDVHGRKDHMPGQEIYTSSSISKLTDLFSNRPAVKSASATTWPICVEALRRVWIRF